MTSRCRYPHHTEILRLSRISHCHRSLTINLVWSKFHSCSHWLIVVPFPRIKSTSSQYV
jgi:hypothetical protein